jgi:TonB family protein
MNWLHYLAEANLYLGVFYLAYCAFLQKETYYQLNRVYLIAGCVISFILPVLQLGVLKPAEVIETTTFSYSMPVELTQQLPVTTTIVPVVTETHLGFNDYLWYAYLIGACVVFAMLIVKLVSLFKLVRNAQRIEQDKYKLVKLPQTDIAFSFFNYLFIGSNAPGANTIIRHELVHIRQKHSVDIIFLEVLKIVNWFNPFIYLLQNSLKTVHEYIADEQTAAYETDAVTYSSFLVNNAYGAGGSSITHSFFNYNLLKKRIIMLNQKRSGNLARLKYLIAAPICAGLLCASTLAFSKDYGWVDIVPATTTTEVPIAQNKIKIAIPIPSSTSKGYDYLHHQVIKTVSYTPTAENQGKTVIVGFDVDKKGMLSNVKIERSGGKEFDTKVLKAFKTFDMPVKDKAGHRRSMVLFYNGQKVTEDNKLYNDDPAFAGFWVVPGWKYKLNRTSKGFEYDQYGENINNVINYRVVIYETGGDFFKASMNEATADQLALLKNKYGYTFPSGQEKNGKLPPPSVFKPGFGRLMGHLQHNVDYAKVGDEKNSFVGVSFNVGADRKISDINIFKPANNGYDAIAKAAFESFDGVVTAKPGKHTFMLNYFSEKGSGDEKVLDGNKYDVNLVIVRPKPGEVRVTFPAPIAPKPPKTVPRKRDKNGAYLSEGRINNGAVPIQTIAPKGTKALFIADGKKYEFTPESLAKYNAKSLLYMSYDKMVVYEKGNVYAEKTWGKYGKVAVLTGNASIRIVEYPFGKENQAATADTVKPDWQKLGKYFANNVHYPAKDRHDTIGGRVITLFAVDADHNLQYAKVIRNPSAAMGNEVIRVLKKCTELNILKPGIQYVLPITFSLGYEDNSEVIALNSRRTGTTEIFNPNGIDISVDSPGSLSLADIVIRGYIKK